jgi:murein DD-endopeptidase MepM/ murein hydrolase activator NlpD
MFFTRKFKITSLLTIALLAAPSIVSAQTPRLPDCQSQRHGDLLANQGNAGIQLDNSTKYLESLFSEEEEPEYDIYTEGWNSNLVNCYQGKSVPNTAVIDVSKFSMPCPGYMTSPYGYRRKFRRMHKGVDLKVNIGDTIRAAFDGRVRLTKYEGKGYGYYVVIRHTNDLETVYGHLSRFLVTPDTYVKAGDPIALGGSTGRSTGPHLHFETRYMGYAINPSAIFDFANQTTHTDQFTFDKRTYQEARNFSPAANAEYAARYQRENPAKPYKASSNSSNSKKSKKASNYSVKKGDTLSRIASRNGTTVAKICKLNGISTKAKLRIGQKLRVN